MDQMKRFLFLLVLVALTAAGPLQAQEACPRVISLYAAHTEILLRLGARDCLIGLSGQESYDGPETDGWQRPPVFSIRDDVEKFLAAKPDFLLVRPMHVASGNRLVEALTRSGIRVHAAQVVRADELYQYWRELAALVGREAAAEAMIADFDARVSAYRRAAEARPASEKPGVFLEAIHSSVKTFTPDSLPAWLVEMGGGRNVAADAKPGAAGLIIADYGPERLLSHAREIDIFISQHGAMNQSTLEQLRERSLYRRLRAFTEGRVYKMREDLLARPTPSLLKGLEEMAALTGLVPEGQSPEAPPSASGPAPSLGNE